jgi:phosphatidylinositol alpha-1,6-mannosyltransferase
MTWIHGIEVWEGAAEHRISWARRAQVLLSNTAYTRDKADRLHGDLSQVRVCWLSTESDELPKQRAENSGHPTVLMVGRLDPGGGYKGHIQLIECWPKVLSCIPTARLLIVGKGPGLNFLHNKVELLRLTDSVQFLGFIPDEFMDGIWAEASLLAMPSRGEGFGLVYIEAMRHGLPIIASIHDAAPEINLDGKTGFNVDLNRPDDLPEKLIFLLQNRDVAAAMGRVGQRRWLTHFRYSAFRERFLPLLNEFLDA